MINFTDEEMDLVQLLAHMHQYALNTPEAQRVMANAVIGKIQDERGFVPPDVAVRRLRR